LDVNNQNITASQTEPLLTRIGMTAKLVPVGNDALLDYLLSSANTGAYATLFGGNFKPIPFIEPPN
jgi:predicted ribonuclease YlaK